MEKSLSADEPSISSNSSFDSKVDFKLTSTPMAKKSTKNETLVLSPVLPEVKIYKHDDFCERLAKLLPSYPRPNIELVRILRYKLRNDPKNAISTKQYNDFHNRIDPL